MKGISQACCRCFLCSTSVAAVWYGDYNQRAKLVEQCRAGASTNSQATLTRDIPQTTRRPELHTTAQRGHKGLKAITRGKGLHDGHSTKTQTENTIKNGEQNMACGEVGEGEHDGWSETVLACLVDVEVGDSQTLMRSLKQLRRFSNFVARATSHWACIPDRVRPNMMAKYIINCVWRLFDSTSLILYFNQIDLTGRTDIGASNLWARWWACGVDVYGPRSDVPGIHARGRSIKTCQAEFYPTCHRHFWQLAV